MCGIVGKITWSPRSSVTRDLMEKMAERLRHRGPDEGGVWIKDNVGLAMRRLKIIDLATGSQPMSNIGCPVEGRSGPVHVVYNGEIYNFREIRADLEKAGHKFRSHSDTEIIVHAYEHYGEGAWDRFNGMFALALYSEREKALYLVRDRMGIKPLYYRSTVNSFSFASEIKALLEDPETSREHNPQSLMEYFSLRYVPTPRSAFQEIQKLEPGHYLKVRNGVVEKERFWNFSPDPPPRKPLSQCLEKLDALLKDSVRSHLVSDVPLGIFLSGGLDSTTLAAYVHEAGQSLNSFTIYFGEQSFSERLEAGLVARQYDLVHNELAVEPDLVNLSERLFDIFDEPFADPSIIPTYYLCQFARSKVTVALSGDGGDELFGGYPTYLADRLAAVYRKFPGPVRNLLHGLGKRLPTSFERVSFDYRMKMFLRSASRPQPLAHFGWQEMFFPEERERLFTEQFLRRFEPVDPAESFVRAYGEAGNRESLEKMLFVDQKTHLLDEYLVKVDRLSMAHSLEVRVPFLDRSLVEFAAAEVPIEYKLSGWTTKSIVRRLMRGKLPKEVLKGKKKGFTPPLAKWLAGELRPWAEDQLSPEKIRKTGILNPNFPLRLLREHAEKRFDHHRRLWTLLSFMGWFERYGTAR